MSYSFPDSVSPYLEQGFLYSLGILAGDAANNVVEIDREKMITTGQFLNIERIDEVDAPVRRDIATTGQTRSFTEMGNSVEVGVVCHDDQASQYPQGNETFAGLDFQAFWLMRCGLIFGRRAKQQLYRVARAAVEVCDTTDGSTAAVDCHINDDYDKASNNTMTFARLQETRALLGDAAGLLTTVVMHSTCWNNLVLSGIASYTVDSVAGRILNTGMIVDSKMREAVRKIVTARIATCDALGMTVIIDDDLTPIAMTGGTYTYKSKYETLLLGPGALLLAYQRGLKQYLETYLSDARGALTRMRAEVDYVPHLRGVKWNSATANPSDVQLGTKSNWASVYSNHKEVLCAKLITNG